MVDSLPQTTSNIKLTHIYSYQKLLDRIPNFAWLMDASGQIYLGNSRWQRFVGAIISPSQPYPIKLLLSEAKISIFDKWQASLVERDTWEDRLQLRDSKDSYIWFALQIEKVIEDRDSLFICTATPVTEFITNNSYTEFNWQSTVNYKQKELVLIRQAEFVRRILESSQDCIKVLDLQGRLLYMNDGGQKIMEIDDFDRQAYNAPWLDFWQGCDRPLAEKAFAEACGGGIGKFDGHCATARGTPKWWEVVVTPMFDENNEVREILSVSRDITSRQIAKEAIEERNQELRRFASIVSHDLKAPLRGISSLSEMIAEDFQELVPTESLHQLDLLRKRVLRMNALIDGLLKYSRIGRKEIPIEPVNMEDLLQETLDSLDPPAGFKITSITPLPTFNTKKILLSQVLSNLISNAIKHHHLEQGQIDLSVKDTPQHYEFAIADDGPGIPEEHRERIFEIFQTLENNTSTINTGIGLPLIRRIVQSEGGKFWLDSQTKKGTKFCFTWKK